MYLYRPNESRNFARDASIKYISTGNGAPRSSIGTTFHSLDIMQRRITLEQPRKELSIPDRRFYFQKLSSLEFLSNPDTREVVYRNNGSRNGLRN